MAISAKELIRWANTLPEDAQVAIDEGGLSIEEITTDPDQTAAYLEVGGTE